MKEKSEKNKRYFMLIYYGVLPLIILELLIIAASLAWMPNMSASSYRGFNPALSDINYSFNDTSENLFANIFEVETSDDYIDEPEIEDGLYIATTNMAITIDGATYSTENPYTTTKGSSFRIVPELTPANSTDRAVFTSSNTDILSVGRYGKVLAIATGTANITVTMVDRRNSTTVHYTSTVKINVGESAGDDESDFNFLPAGSRIIKAAEVAIINHSTTDSKLRCKVSWNFSSLYEGDSTGRTAYSVSDLFASYTGSSRSLTSTPKETAPIEIEFFKSDTTKVWHPLDRNSVLFFIDSDDAIWEITSLFLTDSEHTDLLTAIGNGDISSFPFEKIMIDEADAYFYYGTTASTENDYGDVIPAPDRPSDNNKIGLINQITVCDNYTQFSPKKVFGLNITLQARQANFFQVDTLPGQDDAWYDVSTCNWGTDGILPDGTVLDPDGYSSAAGVHTHTTG